MLLRIIEDPYVSIFTTLGIKAEIFKTQNMQAQRCQRDEIPKVYAAFEKPHCALRRG